MTPTDDSFAEIVNVPTKGTSPVPDVVDPVQVAGLLSPVMANWMTFAARTTGLQKGFTAVILGTAGLSESLAVSIARVFGAGKVVGVARSAAKMSGLGLDAMVHLAEDVAKTDYSAALDADGGVRERDSQDD